MRGTIGIDIDGVLADSDRFYRKLIKQWYNVKLSRQMVSKPNYFEVLKSVEPEREIQRFFKRVTEEDLWQQIEPIEGAETSMMKLRCAGFHLIIVTSRPNMEPMKSETLKWLRNNDIIYDDIVFVSDGNKYGNLTKRSLHLDFFIEDFIEYALQFARNGIPVFLFNYPWNQHNNDKNIRRVSGWSEVMAFLG